MTVTDSDVSDVLGETELTDFSPFIEAAGRMYDDRTDGYNVGGEIRDDVVTRLAAHLVATGPERQISSAGESGGSVSFEGETGEGLKASTHGQIAITLDPTGVLSASDKPGAGLRTVDVKETGYR
jgi:hypothetical protein